MKNKRERTWLIVIVFLFILLSGCEQTPRVYSLENITGRLVERQKVAGVIPEKKPFFSGTWQGLEHEITVCSEDMLPDTLFKVCLIDTPRNTAGSDTSDFYILFMKINGHSFIEVVNAPTKHSDHDFYVVLSTYYKVSRSTNDTLIVQRLDESFCSAYMQKHGYRFFIPSDQLEEKEPNMYITEKAPRLAALLKEIAVYPGAFMKPDTIVRKK